MTREFSGGLVSPSDIAAIANVTRAAVSNWRKRRPDFPAPVSGTVANPLFRRALIEDWLERNGRPAARDAPDIAAWSVMNTYRGRLPIDSMVEILHALMCALKLSDGSSIRENLRRAARTGRLLDQISGIADSFGSDEKCLLHVPSGPAITPEFLESCASDLFQVTDGMTSAEMALLGDQVIGRASSSEGRTSGEYSHSASLISALLARSASRHPGSVYDPVCGLGETLLSVSKLTAAAAPPNLVGHDADAGAVVLARQRFFLHDVAATVSEADVLSNDPDPTLRADAVIAQLPLATAVAHTFSVTDPRWALAGPPPPRSPEAAWLQHVIAHLSPGGRGYVVASPSTTFTTNTAKIRRQLVHAGCVEAVIGLPPKMLPASGAPTVLWVVCPAGASRFTSSVLVVDASALDPSHDLPVSEWLDDPSTLDSTTASWAMIALTDILADEEVSLSPRGLTESKVDAQDIADRYLKARGDFATASRTISSADLGVGEHSFSASRVATIRQLERQGVVSVHRIRGRKKPLVDDENESESGSHVVTARHVRDGLPELRSGSAPVITGRDLTRPGDILVTTMRILHGVVDDVGGRSVHPGVVTLRVDTTQFDPRYVAACVTAVWNQRFETDFYAPHANIRDLEIPVVPLHDQQQLVEILERTRAVAAEAQLAATSADELANVLLESVRFNVDIPVGAD